MIVGYAGTPDAYETTFFNSQFATVSDTDAFVFENNSGASEQLSFDMLGAGYAVWLYQADAGGYPDAGAFAYSCDISSLFGVDGAGYPCQRVAFTTCVPDQATWSFRFRRLEVAGVSCDTPYWFAVDCAPCPKVACCLPSGNCVDGLDEAECNNFLDPAAPDGVPGVPWSSCCYVTCPSTCEGSGIPSGSVADDSCASTNPNTGDLFNSGCDAPDGDPIGKFSTIGYPAPQSWCGSTGTFVRTPPAESPTLVHTETDYYLIDLSGVANDIGIRITVTASSAMSMHIIQDRGPTECPTVALDGTDDVRELDDAVSLSFQPGVTQVFDWCLEKNTQHMLLFEADALVACGTPYHVDIEYFTDGCFAACCNAYLNQAGSGPQGCTLVADVADTLPNEALQKCSSDNLRGTYRGQNTRCTGFGAVTCCAVAQVGGDLVDSDNYTCPATNTANTNRGCINPQGGSFQALGNFTPGIGPNPGTAISVWGTVCRQSTPSSNPTTDNDFYSVNVNAAGGAEYLCTLETNARIAVFAYNATDLELPDYCDIASQDREVLFYYPYCPCDGPVTVAGSGFSVDDSPYPPTYTSICLLGNQLNYFLVQPTVVNDGVEAQYRLTFTAYECRVGACCLDAALCVDDSGYLQCEAVLGGQFVAGASCPNEAAGLALCRGICCVDTGPGVPVCVPNTTAYDCCVLLNNSTFALDSRFAGYSVGDVASSLDCATNPDICEEGACCIDSISGYTCQDNVSAVQCGALTGAFQGIGTACVDNTCSEHPCCGGPSCFDGYSPLQCAAISGVYRPLDESCATILCEPPGACCFSCTSTVAAPCPDPSGPVVGCTILTAPQCLAARGLYVGQYTTCTQGIGGPCDCNGDINGDGNCNTSDFNILAGQFGQGTPTCRTHGQGDLNCDGIVNTSDFNILAGSFGCTRN